MLVAPDKSRERQAAHDREIIIHDQQLFGA